METVKTALLFNPYLDTLGGGERYTFSLAQLLLQENYSVTLAWHDLKTIDLAQKRFNLDLTNLTISAEYYQLFKSPHSLPSKWRALKDLDLIFFVTEGSVPLLFSKNNILHYQVPFTYANRFPLLNQLKLSSINHLVVNSRFTKRVIDHTLNTSKSEVIYPPVDTDQFLPGRKQKLILNVGRFDAQLNGKRQDVLVTAFKSLCDQGLKGWRLVLAGGQMSGGDLSSLKKLAAGYPIKFITNPTFSELKQLYATSTFYWHAAGFEVDEALNPESVEHFGITTVEAMSAACVPLVHNKGGQKEIVDASCGYLWNSVEELVTQTKKLIKDPKLIAKLAKTASTHAQDFSYNNFKQQFLKIL